MCMQQYHGSLIQEKYLKEENPMYNSKKPHLLFILWINSFSKWKIAYRKISKYKLRYGCELKLN